MKCKDLINELMKYNPDADVTTPYSEDICLSYISGNGIDKKTTELIFIEWEDWYVECSHEYMNGADKWCSYYDKECSNRKECDAFEEFDER